MWNVPYVSSIYLIKNTAFKYLNYDHQYYDPDMAMCESLRNAVSCRRDKSDESYVPYWKMWATWHVHGFRKCLAFF